MNNSNEKEIMLSICVITYNQENYKCTIHKVRPMQCAMFPLFPENLKQDFFINSGGKH